MKGLIPILFLAATAAPVDHPRTYLLSVVALPLQKNESIESFSFSTWGVEFRSVCKIPSGWRIKAGGGATPDGGLEGQGSQGVTWFNRTNPPELSHFVLVTLYAPLQRNDIRDGTGVVPATFKGTALVSMEDGERKAPLTYRNISLIPARNCPTK